MVECPVCFKAYPLSEIEMHVELCLTKSSHDGVSQVLNPIMPLLLSTNQSFSFELEFKFVARNKKIDVEAEKVALIDLFI